MSKNDDQVLTGCVAAGIAYILAAVLMIFFWTVVIWGALAGLSHFGVI